MVKIPNFYYFYHLFEFPAFLGDISAQNYFYDQKPLTFTKFFMFMKINFLLLNSLLNTHLNMNQNALGRFLFLFVNLFFILYRHPKYKNHSQQH